ncbi:thiolase domain-containing protein [Nocardioides marmorisolisilvae]|uniref:Lipid-transfer protein n=1 Tax=Nocardioides marmorisolisilvae TaxID=1542737 RepID=A0A3N0DV41_9ACTN|nr:thiolase domain-containing protein [Nocardioides marmorisolisilvae]RNL79487.1 lipid-transfer protein [Nocardioides marmorisolisilvae]
MRDVAVVGFSQQQMKELDGSPTCLEILVPIIQDLYEQTGWTKSDIGFWCSGSSDYLAGRSFSFVSAVDAIGTLPPVMESHVEMDAAWAMYEAWIKIQTGEVDTALVYGFGKSSAGTLRRILALQLDPYTTQPLWPDTVSLAGIQAREGIEKGLWDEKAMAEVVARSMTDAAANEWAIRKGATSIDDVLAQPVYADPLRRWDCAPVSDGAAGIILAAGDKAREARQRPAWITGFEHRIEPIALNARSLTESVSTAAAGTAAGVDGVDTAELHAPFSHQELILRNALGLPGDVTINPSGGALTANPMFSAGLNRIGEAASRIWAGNSDKALAHTTQGPVLQHNLVCTLEGRN